MNFKSLMRFTTMFAMTAAVLLFTACGDDDDGLVIDPGDGGINVADGFYITQSGVDPVANAVLTAEVVEDEGFGTQTRAGYVANYVFLTAGDYKVVEIAAKEIVKSFGGVLTVPNDGGSSCDLTSYNVVESSDGGAAFVVSNTGLYKVTYDALTGEIFMYQIEKAGIIGSATPNGWGGDTELVGSASASGATWEATNVELREGEFKFRFNCNWNIDRRLNKTDDSDFSEAAGYMLFTNVGGTITSLETGGANIAFSLASEGLYTVSLTWNPSSGLAATLTKTGDVQPITFKPDENQWALTGSGTPNGWADDDPNNDPIGVDHDLNYEGVDNGTYTWKMADIALTAEEIKFRANDAWDKNMGFGGILTLAGDSGNFSLGGGDNIKVDVAGNYEIILTTSDEGDSYTATFTKL